MSYKAYMFKTYIAIQFKARCYESMNTIQESDWKYLRNLQKTLLDRLCNRILDNIQVECNLEKRQPGVHQQY